MQRIALAVCCMLILTGVAVAQGPPGTPLKTGQASFTFGGSQVAYGKVTGSINQSYGFTVAMLTFSADGKPTGDNLIIGLMVQKPGPVDVNQMGNGIQHRSKGTIFSYQKGKSQCTISATKLTATSVEGTAECPVVNEVGGSGTGSLTAVKFSASTN
jgi:hypothetical protein